MAGLKLLKESVEAVVEGISKKVSQFGLTPERSLPRHPIGGGGGQNLLKRKVGEMSHEYVEAEPLIEKTIVSPEDLHREGAVIVPTVGDRTPAGRWLTHVNEEKLDRPVYQGGGRDFARDKGMRDPDNPLIWMSAKPNIEKNAANIRFAHELDDAGNPVVATPVGMGWQSGDFSAMQTRILWEMLKNAPVKQQDKILFDAAMRAPGMQPPKGAVWPGIEAIEKNPALLDEWLPEAGVGRTNLARLMDSKLFQDKGFPDVASARKANIDEAQFDDPTGMTGFNLFRADPSGKVVTDPFHKREEYSTGLGGLPGAQPMGLERAVPYDVMFPDLVERMRANAMAKSGHTLDLNNAMQGLTIGLQMAQKTNQKWLEGMMRYLQSPEGRMHGVGGAVSSGILTQAEADEFFGDQL